jgi:DNA repair protein SbcC/Rad50
VGRRLTQDARAGLKSRISRLIDAARRLATVKDSVESGAIVIRREAEARGRLSLLRRRDSITSEVRLAIDELCVSLGQNPVDTTEKLVDAIQRLETHVAAQEKSVTERLRRRTEALTQFRALQEQESTIDRLQQTIASDTNLRQRKDNALAMAERRRQSAKAVARAAANTRAAIVGRVFNSSLNMIWRDLFGRLAPTEPFVPAFRVPQSADGPITAQLETVHRDGGVGGAPGTMLSAGNLNTAALTLFLALHLSVKPQLPWLILDDPVQSMDELHIANFAAVLRTLSKEHHRQIIIAVHERPLFDYLALELSPAFPEDQLITVEVNRSSNGFSVAEPTYHKWQVDRAVAV